MTDQASARPLDASAAPGVDAWTDRLGRLVERYPNLWIRLGDMETRLLRDRIDGAVIDRPIYVAGLARSGSTILLELLARHPDTASHRYRDFPLVLAPWAWNWFVDRAARTEHVAQERAHRDRIKITPESPEAFEELVWMAFHPALHDPSRSALFDEAASHPRFEAFYRDHIRKLLVLRSATRYLAKGNYNVTRLRYLKKLFPGARFVVPVRDPVWHVASLMKQHRLFTAAERDDERVLHHMRRSGHFEFGLDRRPINVGEDGAARAIRDLWQGGQEVAGWAAYWAAVYGHVAEILEAPELGEAALVVRYEDLCSDPGATMTAILDHCALSDAGVADIARTTVAPPAYYEPSFTPSERRAIREATQAVAARFGYH
jgi:hypothetical protein